VHGDSALGVGMHPSVLERRQCAAASERRGDTLRGLTDIYLKAKASIGHWLSHMCHIRSTAEGGLLILLLRTGGNLFTRA